MLIDASWFSNFVFSGYPFFLNGGGYDCENKAGIFASYTSSGYGIDFISFRTCLSGIE